MEMRFGSKVLETGTTKLLTRKVVDLPWCSPLSLVLVMLQWPSLYTSGVTSARLSTLSMTPLALTHGPKPCGTLCAIWACASALVLPYSNGRSGTPVPDNLINESQTGSAGLFKLLNYLALYKLLRYDSGYYTRFRQNSEVKHLWARIVLGWVTS
jgi:hypothetical protein